MVSSLNSDNAHELISFAKAHSLREIDFKIAEGNPEKTVYDKITPLSKDHIELRCRLSKSTLEKLKRAQVKPVKVKIGQNSVKQSFRSTPREPLTAAQKHAVAIRDQGKCTHIDLTGRRCNQDRWTDTHHIIPVNKGGTNDPENLTTLCSYHHDLVHQLSLEIDGQVYSPGPWSIFFQKP